MQEAQTYWRLGLFLSCSAASAVGCAGLVVGLVLAGLAGCMAAAKGQQSC